MGLDKDHVAVWALYCQQHKFDLESERFNKLIDLGVESSRKVKRRIREERKRFLDAAQVINDALVGMFDSVKELAIRRAFQDLQQCATGLDEVMCHRT